jgi:hypothetical protein
MEEHLPHPGFHIGLGIIVTEGCQDASLSELTWESILKLSRGEEEQKLQSACTTVPAVFPGGQKGFCCEAPEGIRPGNGC